MKLLLVSLLLLPTLLHAQYLTTKLVAGWRAEDASATTSIDWWGGNDMTEDNAVTAGTGIVGTGYGFDGNSRSYYIADNADLSFGDEDFSLVVWVNATTFSSEDKAVFGKYDAGSDDREYKLEYDHSPNAEFRFIVSSDGTSGTATSLYASTFGTPSTSTWYMIYCANNSTRNILQISVNNGTIDSGSHTSGCNDNISNFRIGKAEGDAAYWNGVIDAVMVFSDTLTSTELTWLYNGGDARQLPYRFHVSTETGSDTDLGSTWTDAWATISESNNNNLAEGDTLIVADGSYAETFNPTPDGASDRKITLIDSLRYTDGWDEADPDTLWPTIITGSDARSYGLQFSGDDYWNVIGFQITECNLYSVSWDNSDGNRIQQCNITGTPSSSDAWAIRMTSGSSADSVISCLVNTTSFHRFQILNNATGSIYVVNNTFYGNNWDSVIELQSASAATFENNIVENTSTTSGDRVVVVTNAGTVGTFDYNTYDIDNAGDPWESPSSTTYSTLSAWRTWVQANGDADGEDNSYDQEPVLVRPTTVGIIAYSDSEAGVDRGYGTRQGYYQPTAPAASGTATRRRFVRPN